jgi:dTDP-4-dehydrorhamnose 3,5-epimerase
MSGRFTVVSRPADGVVVLQRKVVADQRGSFHRMFCADDLKEVGWVKPVAQVNFTTTPLRGTVRGMHFQKPPYAEMKLVTCVSGKVFDVIVDLRAGSKSFLKWFSVELSEENNRSLVVPEGFAHGFQALTDNVQLLYSMSAPHAADAESRINPLDAALQITWPLPITCISERDAGQPHLAGDFTGLNI